MASTSQSYRTVQSSNQPSASSSLLDSGEWSNYNSSEVSQRPLTPAESIIRQEWYTTLLANTLEYWENVRDLFTSAFLMKKLKAILKCLCLPYVVLERTLNGPRRQFRPQTGIMYLYVYLCVTVVLNLTVVLTEINLSMAEFNLLVALNELNGSTAEFNLTVAVNEITVWTAECVQKSFVIFSMFLAIFLMCYLYRFTYQTVDFPHSRRRLFRIFYEGGILIFGFSSFGYSIAAVIAFINECVKEPGTLYAQDVLSAIVACTKAIFILVQIVFLHFFYEARIPEESPHIEVIMAHLLGTNLALWFWTLCSEETREISNDCLGDTKKYFLPLFVEYLLLAASLFYQMWKDASTRNPTMSPLQRYIHQQLILPNNTIDTLSENGTDRNSLTSIAEAPRRHNPRSCLGFIIGGVFAAVFIVLVVFASLDIDGDHSSHKAHSIAILILYLAQICACFICQVSLQSHQLNPEHLSLDHEDILLYFSLIGIVLWEGLNAYTILLQNFPHASAVFVLTEAILAIAQQLFQTVTLVLLRRHKGTHDQCSIWICECIWFLLVTNLTLWVQNSFYIKVAITTPSKTLKSVGYIFRPLSIFYRFHSAVCCVLARSLFKS